VPEHVLTVLDEAYFEYVDHPEYPDGIEEYAKAGRRVLVLRTFSKIYGLAGLRVGYGVGPDDVVAAIAKVRNAFDVSQLSQDAALASLGNDAEVARRRGATAAARAGLERVLRAAGFRTAAPAVANFVYADVEGDARVLFERLLREGIIVRPLAPFGAPEAIRVTVGSEAEHELLASALDRVLPATVGA
jgi:histidinol-phosphate aminotransferase